MVLVWTEVEASHLLGRVGFGYTKQELEAAVALGQEATVDRLLLGKSLTDQTIDLPPIEKVISDGKPLVADRISDHQTYWLYKTNGDAGTFNREDDVILARTFCNFLPEGQQNSAYGETNRSFPQDGAW